MASDYTHIKLLDVEDLASQPGATGHQARFPKRDLETRSTGVGHHRLEPGRRQAVGHRHDTVEEVYVVIAGSGWLALDDEVIEVERLDVIRVAPQVMRCFEAGPDGLDVLACGPRHDGDSGDVVPGWWGG